MRVLADVIQYSWTVWTWVFLIWLFTRMGRQGPVYQLLQETKFLFKVITVAKMGVADPANFIDGLYWLPIIWGVDLMWLHFIKDLGDDDRWKKRRQKVTAKVKEVAGRLVVVPELAPAPSR